MRIALSLLLSILPVLAWSQPAPPAAPPAAAPAVPPAAAPAAPPSDDAPPPPPPNCSPAEFRTLALDSPEPKRAQSVLRWLQSSGKDCSLDRLIIIRNNRVQWLGSADSAAVAGEIDRLIELGMKEDAEGVSKLYRSAVPAAAPAAQAGAKP